MAIKKWQNKNNNNNNNNNDNDNDNDNNNNNNKNFPKKHRFYKLFNRNNMKVS